jgi:hypothetical protein
MRHDGFWQVPALADGDAEMNQMSRLFADGEAYERLMGRWSRLAGEIFLDWLDPLANVRWLDVGCGNGAFTEALFARCDPIESVGGPTGFCADAARSKLGPIPDR